MQRSSEPMHPPVEHVRRINEAASVVAPSASEFGGWFKAYARNHAQRLAQDLRLVQMYASPGDSILEFGAIPLLLTLPMQRMGYDVTGVDIDPSRFSQTIARESLRVVACNIETEPLPLQDSSWDVAIFNELFEHLRVNPIFTLREVRRVLRPGGTLLLSTPNLRSLRGIYNFAVKNKAYSCSDSVYEQYAKLEELGHMGHVREYTVPEVVEFLDRVGFDVREVVFRGSPYPGRLGRAFGRLVPSLRPFVSYVATPR